MNLESVVAYMFRFFMPNEILCGLQYCSQLVRVVMKKGGDGLKCGNNQYIVYVCLPDAIRRTRRTGILRVLQYLFDNICSQERIALTLSSVGI
jgi:hypothetical protein